VDLHRPRGDGADRHERPPAGEARRVPVRLWRGRRGPLPRPHAAPRRLGGRRGDPRRRGQRSAAVDPVRQLPLPTALGVREDSRRHLPRRLPHREGRRPRPLALPPLEPDRPPTPASRGPDPPRLAREPGAASRPAGSRLSAAHLLPLPGDALLSHRTRRIPLGRPGALRDRRGLPSERRRRGHVLPRADADPGLARPLAPR